MTTNRQFLTGDIMAMSTTAQRYPFRMSEWLETLTEDELKVLWSDLVEKEALNQ